MSGGDLLDNQIAQFHQLADLPREQLVAEATEHNRAALSALVQACLPDTPALDAMSAEHFADFVLELRDNERMWNQALSQALIHAENLLQSKGAVSAASALRSFAESCPWSPFRDVALNQADSYALRP